MQNKEAYDVIIIGTGPAGLSAAIYTSRAELKTLVFGIAEKSSLYKAHTIENFFGKSEGIKGKDLLSEGRAQAAKFQAQFVEKYVVGIAGSAAESFTVTDEDANVYKSKTVIICSGLGFKPACIKNEKELIGRGVSFCVTCDGPFFKNKKCAVVGNGNFAGEEALQLAGYTRDITVLSGGSEFVFSDGIGKLLKEKDIKLKKTPKITEFTGKEKLEAVKFTDGSVEEFSGIFMALGVASASDFAVKLGLRRMGPQDAYLIANLSTGETNVKGIFAAGDCLGGNTQVSKSVGEGCNAAVSVIKFVKGISVYRDYC